MKNKIWDDIKDVECEKCGRTPQENEPIEYDKVVMGYNGINGLYNEAGERVGNQCQRCGVIWPE